MSKYPPWLGANEVYEPGEPRKGPPPAPPCRESHPVLQLGGGRVAGGSCFHAPEGFDIYVGLEHGMERHDHFPWDPGPHPVDISYPITDGSAPKNPGNFKKLVLYLKEALAAGKDVAIGCIGGHGRSGMLIAALYKEITGDPDAIKWVRENYCEKAVESRTQVEFLMRHFGVKRAAGYKEYAKPAAVPSNGGPWSGGKITFVPTLPGASSEEADKARAWPDPRAAHLKVWGDNVRLTNY